MEGVRSIIYSVVKLLGWWSLLIGSFATLKDLLAYYVYWRAGIQEATRPTRKIFVYLALIAIGITLIWYIKI